MFPLQISKFLTLTSISFCAIPHFLFQLFLFYFPIYPNSNSYLLLPLPLYLVPLSLFHVPDPNFQIPNPNPNTKRKQNESFVKKWNKFLNLYYFLYCFLWNKIPSFQILKCFFLYNSPFFFQLFSFHFPIYPFSNSYFLVPLSLSCSAFLVLCSRSQFPNS